MRTDGPVELGQRLQSLLRGVLGRDIEYEIPLQPLAGGAFSDMFVFSLTGAPPGWSGRLVLRFVSSSEMQVRIEAGLQEGACVAGVKAPRVLLVEHSAEPLGTPFMVMEFLPGRAFLRGIEWYRFARDFPRMLMSWPATFADTLALLARADTAPVIDALARHGVALDEARTSRHLSWIARTLGTGTRYDRVLAWLRANEPPAPDRLYLVHGDLWPGNVLMQHGAVAGVVDWTMGAIGDPALDVGFAKVGLALMPEPFPPPPPISTVVHAGGVRLAKRIHEICAPLVGGDERVSYYEALRCMVQIAAAHADRQNNRINGWEHGIPALNRHLNTTTGVDVYRE